MKKSQLVFKSTLAVSAIAAFVAPTVAQAATVSVTGNADGRKTNAAQYSIKIEPRLTDKQGAVVTPKGGTYTIQQIKKVASDGSEAEVQGTPVTITLDDQTNTINVPEDGVYKVTPGARIPGYHKDKGFKEGSTYRPYEYSFPAQSAANAEFYDAATQTITMVPKLTPVNGTIAFQKTGDDGQGLAGVTFSIEQLTDAKTQTSKEAGTLQNGVTKTVTTAADGQVSFADLPEGTYKVTETSSAAGYAVDTREVLFEVTVNDSDEVVVRETTAEKVLSEANKFANYKQPTPDKKVKTHVSTDYSDDKQSTNFDRQVDFEFTSVIPKDIATYKTYELVDELAEQFDIATLDKSKVTVEADGAAAQADVTLEGRTLKVAFNAEQRKALAGKANVKVHFSISLDAAKAKQDVDVDNTVTLNWDNNHGAHGNPTDKVTITPKEGNLEVTKRANSATGDALAGAKFKLWREARTGETGQRVGNKDNLVLATDSSKAVVGDNLTSDAQGKIVVKRLPFGKYYLQETEAPTGYRLNKDLKEVTIGDTEETIDYKGEQLKDGVKASVINYKETQWFPATGTLGITVAASAFGGLAVSAGWLQKKKKEMSK